MSEALARALARMEVDYAPLGRVKSQQMWECADGWQIAWTTSKVIGGPYDGKYTQWQGRDLGAGLCQGIRQAR
jgi:hypothetical protein